METNHQFPEFENIARSLGIDTYGCAGGAIADDFDNDGGLDFLITNNNGPVRLARNQSGQAHGWLGLRLLTPDGKRDATGARAAIVTKDGTRLWRRARVDGSYASSSDPRIIFGLGEVRGAQTVEVRWPDGNRERFGPLAMNRYHVLRQGSARVSAR